MTDMRDHGLQAICPTVLDWIPVGLVSIHVVLGESNGPWVIDAQVLCEFMAHVIITHCLQQLQLKPLILQPSKQIGTDHHTEMTMNIRFFYSQTAGAWGTPIRKPNPSRNAGRQNAISGLRCKLKLSQSVEETILRRNTATFHGNRTTNKHRKQIIHTLVVAQCSVCQFESLTAQCDTLSGCHRSFRGPPPARVIRLEEVLLLNCFSCFLLVSFTADNHIHYRYTCCKKIAEK